MNRIFRVVWSRALECWVVASETAMRRGKRGRSHRRSRGLAAISAAAWIAFFSPPASHAQSWTGTTSTDWTVAGNWSTGTVPTGTATVTINTSAPNPTVLGVTGAANATIGLLQMGMTAGTSALTVRNGSTLSSSVTTGTNYIGNASGTNASFTVTGPGSAWSTRVSTFVGAVTGSTGRLNIADGATASLANLMLGQGGANGSGALNVTGGAVLNTTNATMFALGTNAAAGVSDAGSQWNVNGALTVGSGRPGGLGRATMTVSGGGAVAATGNVTIGATSLSTSGNGTVIVTGTGSRLDAGGALNIGLYGNGVLTISDGATVTAGAVKMTTGVASVATLNMAGGGILSAQSLTGGPGTAQASFDGATLRVRASNASFISGYSATGLNLAAGGLTLDTDAFDVTVASPFSGMGAFTKAGTGTLLMTADNSYSGSTTISAGTLLINGNQSAATGATSVLNGGTLGGTGTIGGDVSVADGGTLAPGNSPGTLTINGSLALAAGAQLNYELGQAGTPGGALNDLTVVHGNLTLDGTLNAIVTPDGSFGAGVYRIFSYDGALTDNGLAIGTLPAADATVQTSIAHQVNLVNTAGLTLNFWDGPGHGNDGSITGGNGTWRLTDNDYWTDASGALNAPYSNASFAVFGGTGGTVTVDDSNGQVSASGMQFQSNGYRVTGDALELIGGASSIRVGDGSALGAGVTAAIDSVLTGGAMLVKDDLGTLVLTGANLYSGGTDVHAGSLQVASDANLGAASGAVMIDDATLHTTGSFQSGRGIDVDGAATIETDGGTTLTLTNGIGGSGSLEKSGSGTLVLDGTSTYAGATTVAAGTLAAASNHAFNAASAFTVAGGATLDLAGHGQQLASLSNAGTVHFGTAPGTTLTVRGDYAGQGGTLLFNTALGSDTSASDMLVVGGDTSGDTVVQVSNVGGAGAQTANGIKLIDVAGQSNGKFTLQGDYVFQGQPAVVAGAYAYRLYKDGANGTADGDWYLRSALATSSGGDGPTNPSNPSGPSGPSEPVQPLYQPGVPMYEAYAGVLQQLNKLDTLVERTGQRQWSNGQATGWMTPGEGLWMRVQGSDQTLKPEASTSGTHYEVSTWSAETGIDTVLVEGETGKLVGGATLQYGRNHSDVHSVYGQGRIKTNDYGVGASLTWYGDQGFYVDGQVRATQFDTDLRSTTLGRSLKDGNKGRGYALGVEMGRRFGLGDHLWAIPQAQLSYGSARFDSFNDAFGTRVSLQEGRALTARGGLAIDYDRTWQGRAGPMASHVYAIANLYKTTKDGARVDVAGAGFTTRNESTWGGFGLGTSLDWAGGRYSVYGEVRASTGLSHFGDSHAVNGNLGFRMRW